MLAMLIRGRGADVRWDDLARSASSLQNRGTYRTKIAIHPSGTTARIRANGLILKDSRPRPSAEVKMNARPGRAEEVIGGGDEDHQNGPFE